jgi:hypothetical protein
MPAILPDTPAVETAIIEMTNAYRGRQKLGAVKANPELTQAARAYAAYLAKSGKFSHTADGRQFGDRIAATGYSWCQASENLAMHASSMGFEARSLAQKSVEGWINSPPHRTNLVAPNVTEIGVGVARASDTGAKYISVQLFARPQSLQYEFQISNTTRESIGYVFAGETHEVEASTAITHTSCNPGDISFTSVGQGSKARRLAMRYEALDGLVYKLEPDDGSGVRIAVTPLERLR